MKKKVVDPKKKKKKLMKQDYVSCYSMVTGRFRQLTAHLHSDISCQFSQASEFIWKVSELYKKEAPVHFATMTEEPQ